MKKQTEETRSSEVKKKRHQQGMPVTNPNAAGIDIGDTMHAVAISDGKGGHIVREIDTYTGDLEAIVKWLLSEDITTVAMESTGVYWLNLYLMLEESGIEPYLVNAKHVKNVTGRKKDDTDAIWLQKLHSCGLLQKSFQPEGQIRTLRTYVRHRKNLISIGSDSTRRMQKALELMNVKLHTVISDLLGKTGMQMVVAIINGERNPKELLKYKDARIKASDDEIMKSLNGIWKDEYLFTLKQSYDEYMFYQSQMQECESKIAAILFEQAAKVREGDITEICQKKRTRKNELGFDAQELLKIIVGVDLCEVDGISEISALELISEIGLDMNKWISSKHFSAWLNLVPNTKITGGKIISSKMKRKKNHAGQTLRMASCNLIRSKAPIGHYARKMKAKLGKKGGVIATAHKLSRTIYTMIKNQQPYDKTIIMVEHEKWKQTRIKNLERQLAELKSTA